MPVVSTVPDLLPPRLERGPADHLTHRVVLPLAPAVDDLVLPVTRRVVSGWLRERFAAAPHASGVHDLGPNAQVTIASTFRPDGTEDALRLQVVEDTPDGPRTTTVVARRAADAPAVVLLDVQRPPTPGKAAPGGPPRLIRHLVHELRPADGPFPLSLKPHPVTAETAGRLARWLEDPARRRPVILAAGPARPDAGWQARARMVLDAGVGSATLFQLTDRAAVEEFNQAAPGRLAMEPGMLQTLMPAADPATEGRDVRQHLAARATQLRDPADRTYRTLVEAVRLQALAQPWPEQLREVGFFDDRAALAAAARAGAEHAADAARAAAKDAQALRSEVAVLTGLLEESDALHRGCGTAASRDVARIASLEGALTAARSDVRALQQALAGDETGQPGDLLVPGQGSGPQSMQELFAWAELLPHLVLPADRDLRATLRLDEHPKRSVWAAKAWTALQALEDYAAAAERGFRGGFFTFCLQPPADAQPFPVKQVAMVEGQQTMVRWPGQRRFPVPADVDPSGFVDMQAHLKLDNGGIAPRVHFHDATASHQRIWVGYIGAHLVNTRT